MHGQYAGKSLIGYMSLSHVNDGIYELHNLSVLPEFRHRGFGRSMLDFAKEVVLSLGGKTLNVAIIDESNVLKAWYVSNGFKQIEKRKFDHLPFTSGYLDFSVK
ncbi:MAG: GNAT family N-acetyltransferase [Ruminococcaceae bacterium]|nr:GNAT family N-acetyltransferase [Oscillospiraceae bacterium]